LKLTLRPSPERRMPSVPAYEAYLQYRSYQWQFTHEASQRSRECLERALALSPKYADLHNFRGVALCELDRVEEGIAAFRRAAALNPDYLVPRINLAFAQLRAGQFKEAETQLEAVLEQDPTQPAASIKLEELRTGRLPEPRRGSARGNPR